MATPDKLQIKIINPEEAVFEGEASFVVAPSKHGSLGIMPGHTAMYAELLEGEIHVADTPERVFPITSGILRVKDNIVTILIGF